MRSGVEDSWCSALNEEQALAVLLTTVTAWLTLRKHDQWGGGHSLLTLIKRSQTDKASGSSSGEISMVSFINDLLGELTIKRRE